MDSEERERTNGGRWMLARHGDKHAVRDILRGYSWIQKRENALMVVGGC